jgi:hypothetical protein
MSPWQSVPPADAAAHRLYGFRGWLIVYYVFALAWLVVWGRSVFGNERMLLVMFESESQVALMRWVMALDLAALLPFLVLIPMKSPLAATLGMYGLVAHGVIRPLASVVLVDINQTKVTAIIGTHVSVAVVFVLYMLFSKRFNVTYRHRIKAA